MTRPTNVNTEFQKSQAGSDISASLSLNHFQQQLADIDQQARDTGTLLTLMLQQVDAVTCDRPDVARALTAIECLAKSAMRNSALILDARAEISLRLEGGAA